jgi:predicted acetyltransferase
MQITLRKVQIDDREILANLLEKYDYEFSQYDGRDVNKLGLYGYEYLDYYWTEDKRWAYFIEADGKLAGFAMVIDLPEVEGTETDFQMAEFFVMYKYRRLGIGKKAVFQVFDKHKGRWQLRRHPKNIASVKFWDNVIDEYTKGQYELIKSHPKLAYADGTLGDVFFFNS